MKTCKVIHGPKSNPITEIVQILGILASARLDAKMARQFARTSPGHLNGVSVIDEAAGLGYRFYSGKAQSHRRFEVLAECDRIAQPDDIAAQDKFYNDRNRKQPRRKHVLPSDVGEIAPG